MKKIGIIGGLGPESTVAYYQEIIGHFNRTGRPCYPEIYIHSANIHEMMELIAVRDWPAITGWLLAKVEGLARAGADFAAIASNTPHIVFDDLAARSPLPLVSIVEATCRQASAMGLKKAGLLGTRLTMESDFYPKAFRLYGMEMVVPRPEEQELIHRRLFAEIELGIFKDATRAELLGIARRLVDDHGIEGLILGCTELPLILPDSGHGIPFLNTTAIHCQRIIDLCLTQ